MFEFSSYPFVRPAVALACGIAVNLFSFEYQKSDVVWISISLTIALLGLSLIPAATKFTNRYRISGLMLLSSVFFAGFTLSAVSRYPSKANFAFADNADNSRQYLVTLSDDIAEKQNSWRVEADVVAVIDSARQQYSASGRMLLYWPKKATPVKPNHQYGDMLIIGTRAIPIPGAAFPEDFDFSAVMRYKNITHQAFLRPDNWNYVKPGGNVFIAASKHCRRWIVNRITGLADPKTAALLVSLIAGSREYLDQSDVLAFSQTGTMHVLAVSGMHAGLIYAILVLLVSGRRSENRLKWHQSVFVLSGLWFFAFVSGLSDSVVRAAIMCSVLELGRSYFPGKGSLINSLFASAFIQLLISPLSLISTGFQLSYAAVLGIALFYNAFSSFWMPSGRVAKFIYSSALLSTTATLGTLPVSLYYFHSFPVWFIPANLIVVPLITILMVLGIALLLLGSVPLAGMMLAKISFAVAFLVYKGVGFFGQLSSKTNINAIPSLHVAGLICALIASFAWLIFRPTIRNAIYPLCISCIIVLVGIIEKFKNQEAQEAIVCEIRSQVICAIKTGDSLCVFSNRLNDSMIGMMKQYMGNYCTIKGVNQITWNTIDTCTVKHSLWMLTRSQNKLHLNWMGKDYVILTSNTQGIVPDATAELISSVRNKSQIHNRAIWLNNNFVKL